MTQSSRGTQTLALVFGALLLAEGLNWAVDSIRYGHAIASYKSFTYTGPYAWVLLASTLVGGAAFILTSLRHLRKARGGA